MPKRPPPAADGALYVRLPAVAVEKLHRAAQALGIAKKDLVAGLVSKYVDPDSRRGLTALGELSQRRVTIDAGDSGPTVGSYSFQPHEPPEVMSVEQTAELLQLDAKLVRELAEAGTLPGKKLGAHWRFSRTALIAWLSSPEPR